MENDKNNIDDVNNTENKNKEDEINFLYFQEKNRNYIKTKYENKDFKLDSMITPLIMVLSTFILFFESLSITLIPLLSENQMLSKFFTLIFDWYLVAEEICIGFSYYISTSINDDNCVLLKSKCSDFVDKILNIYNKISDIYFSKNKEKIQNILKNIPEDSSERES